VVVLRVANWTYAPRSFSRGLGVEQVLQVAFSNGGNDIMHDTNLTLVKANGITVSPKTAHIGDLGPGQPILINFSVLVPEDVPLGPCDLLFQVTYLDFLGRTHSEDLTAQVQVTKIGVNISLTLVPHEARLLDDVEVLVELSDELGRPLADMAVELLLDRSPLADLRTNSSGMAEHSFRASRDLGRGIHTVEAVFQGTSKYEAASTSALLLLRLRRTTLNVTYPREAEVGSTVEIRAVLYDEDGVPVAGALLTLYVLGEKGWSPVEDGVTGQDGSFTFTYKAEKAGEVSLKVLYVGDDVHEACETTFTINFTGGLLSGSTIVWVASGVTAASLAAIAAIYVFKRRKAQ